MVVCLCSFLFLFWRERERTRALATDPKLTRKLEVSKSLIMNCLYRFFPKVSSVKVQVREVGLSILFQVESVLVLLCMSVCPSVH